MIKNRRDLNLKNYLSFLIGDWSEKWLIRKKYFTTFHFVELYFVLILRIYCIPFV